MRQAEQRAQQAEQGKQQAEQREQQAEQGKQQAEQRAQQAEAGDWSLLKDLCQLRCIQMQHVPRCGVACLQPPR